MVAGGGWKVNHSAMRIRPSDETKEAKLKLANKNLKEFIKDWKKNMPEIFNSPKVKKAIEAPITTLRIWMVDRDDRKKDFSNGDPITAKRTY